MAERGITEDEVYNCLARGFCGSNITFERGTWRYPIGTPSLVVVVAFDSETLVIVVTTWRQTWSASAKTTFAAHAKQIANAQVAPRKLRRVNASTRYPPCSFTVSDRRPASRPSIPGGRSIDRIDRQQLTDRGG